MRKRVTARTAERLIRAAYEFEALAVVLRCEGWDAEGNSVGAIASQFGKHRAQDA